MDVKVNIKPFSHGKIITTEHWEGEELIQRDVRVEVTESFRTTTTIAKEFTGENNGYNSSGL